MKIVGFKGARKGLTPEQKESLKTLLAEEYFEGWAALHNDLVESDREFAEIAQARGLSPLKLGTFGSKMDKNAYIVKRSQVLIAAPSNEGFIATHGGTWESVKFAWKVSVMVVIIWPSGKVLPDARRSDLKTEKELNKEQEVASILKKLNKPFEFDVEHAIRCARELATHDLLSDVAILEKLLEEAAIRGDHVKYKEHLSRLREVTRPLDDKVQEIMAKNDLSADEVTCVISYAKGLK